MVSYEFFCNECREYGRRQDDAVAARYDALSHEAHPMEVEVQRVGDGGSVLVVWRPADGLGEDGQSHIS